MWLVQVDFASKTQVAIIEVPRDLSLLTFSGSTPGDSMKNIGVVLLDSSNDLENSMLFLSVYFDPSFSSMKALEIQLKKLH